MPDGPDMLRADRPFFTAQPVHPTAWLFIVVAVLAVLVPFGDRTVLQRLMPAGEEDTSFRNTVWIGLGILLLIQSGWYASCFFARRVLGRSRGREVSIANVVWYTRPAEFRRFPLDVTLWLQRTGAHGPRILLDRTPPPEIIPDEQPLEEVDLITISSAAARRSWRPYIVLVAMCGPGLLFVTTAGAAGAPHFYYLAIQYGIMALIVGGTFGLIPIALRSIVVSPGRVEAAGLMRAGTFTRADSILVIRGYGQAKWLAVTIHRADGRMLRVPLPRGLQDPALHQLVTRWSLDVSKRKP